MNALSGSGRREWVSRSGRHSPPLVGRYSEVLQNLRRAQRSRTDWDARLGQNEQGCHDGAVLYAVIDRPRHSGVLLTTENADPVTLGREFTP